MNVNTGELRILASGQGNTVARDLMQLKREGFTPVPEEHENEALEILAEKQQTIVDMTSDTPLVNWAKSQRTVHKPDSRNKRSMRKKSQRINRRS